MIIAILIIHTAWGIDVQGFSEVCHYFLTKHVEALRQCYRECLGSSSSMLEGNSMLQSRAEFLMKQASEGHHSGKG